MRSAAAWLSFVGLVIAVAIAGSAQERTDPRVGLKPGFRDAGQAALNMELVSSLPKPEGFFDPKTPAGPPTPPERDPRQPSQNEPAASGGTPAASGGAPAPAGEGSQGGTNASQRPPAALGFAN